MGVMNTPTDMDTLERDQLLRVLLLLDLMLMLRLTPTTAIGVDTTDLTMAMGMDTWERRKGLLMRKLKLPVPTLKQRLMLMVSTPMDMAMDTPTDMDTSLERDQLMRVLLPLDLMLTQKLTLIMAIGVDTTDPTMAMDTWERRKGLLRLMPSLMLTQRLILPQVLRLMLTLALGGAIMDTPMAAIMAMVTIPMDTTGA